MTLKNFLSLLFDEGQTTCFSDSPYGYKVSHEPKSSDIFYCINALHPFKDNAPQKEWHNANVPRRADINVVCYRNLLIELDGMPLEDQVQYVTSLVPVSAITYSGKKSHHFIISLETPLKDGSEYREVSRRLHKLVTKADHSTKNPSRLSRLPFRTRPETNLEQRLIYLGERIPNAKLIKLLPEVPTYSNSSTDETRTFLSPLIMRAVMSPDEMMQERGLGGRNAFFHWLGRRLDDVHMDLERKARQVVTAYQNLQDVEDFSLDEAMSAARVRQDS